MTYKDFQIGDIVGVKNHHGWVHIESLTKDSAIVSEYGEVPYENIAPAQLWYQLLEQKGFVYLRDIKAWCLFKVEIGEMKIVLKLNGAKTTGPWTCSSSEMQILYVHQLQHVMRLCNIDDEIQL